MTSSRLQSECQCSQSPIQLCSSPRLIPLQPTCPELCHCAFRPSALSHTVLPHKHKHAPQEGFLRELSPSPHWRQSWCTRKFSFTQMATTVVWHLDKEKGQLRNWLWILAPRGPGTQQWEPIGMDGRGRAKGVRRRESVGSSSKDDLTGQSSCAHCTINSA